MCCANNARDASDKTGNDNQLIQAKKTKNKNAPAPVGTCQSSYFPQPQCDLTLTMLTMLIPPPARGTAPLHLSRWHHNTIRTQVDLLHVSLDYAVIFFSFSAPPYLYNVLSKAIQKFSVSASFTGIECGIEFIIAVCIFILLALIHN